MLIGMPFLHGYLMNIITCSKLQLYLKQNLFSNSHPRTYEKKDNCRCFIVFYYYSKQCMWCYAMLFSRMLIQNRTMGIESVV